MARDRAFPFSKYFAKVSETFGIPLRAMLAIVVIDLIIGLIVLGSDLAFESIISGGGVTLQIGYVTPVIVVRLPHLSMSYFLLTFLAGSLPWKKDSSSPSELRPWEMGIPNQYPKRVLEYDCHNHVLV